MFIAIRAATTATFLALVGTANATCPVASGDTVELKDPISVFELYEKAATEKDEFETTAEYQARRKAAEEALASNQNLLIAASYDPEHVSYNADRETFTIKEYAWDNLAMDLWNVFPKGNRDGIRLRKFGNYAIPLQQTMKQIGEYEASNAFGATTQILQVYTTTYGIFDRAAPGADFETEAPDEWRTDLKIGSVGYPAISLRVPKEQARQVKEGMKVGVAISPKRPFVRSAISNRDATMREPIEETLETHILVADIHCALIVSPDNVVLRTIETNY